MVLVTAKAVTAPISIMPSTPRLSTPDFSATSSPRAARSSGVAAPMMVIRMEMVTAWLIMTRLRRGRRGGGGR